MGLLLLLTSTLLSSYYHPWTVVNAQRLFTIRDITLSIEPGNDVPRDTNVTLRCRATVSSQGDEVLSREYIIYKDSNTIYTKTSSTSEDLLYQLPQARVSNTGKYKCAINIEGKQMTSQVQKLTVTGLAKPHLKLSNGVVREGEEVTATCSAPGETGSIFFYFYEDSNEIQERQVSSNEAEAKLHFSSVGIHKVHCAYVVLVPPDSTRSLESNIVTVSVKELPITVVLEIRPAYNIYEGDQLDISCSISSALRNPESVHLYLSQGTQLLSTGNTKVNHSMVALAKDPGEFECKLEMGNVEKAAIKNISVTELFSTPTLTMSPAEVFQKDWMTLTCNSNSFASERLSKEDLTYSLDPPQHTLTPKGNGVFSGKALSYDFNYTCIAQAKGIMKRSKTLTVQPKVAVSIPKIWVVGKAVLGQPFKIRCQSDIGTHPINYTLWKGYDSVSSINVRMPSQEALFTVTINRPEEINLFTCKAMNSKNNHPVSKILKANVTEPLSNPTLTVIPSLSDISEGDHLYLICGIKGTPPVTFKWYRVGSGQPLNTTTSYENNSNYQVPLLSKDHSGTYYCEASNHANKVRSDPVIIEVHMALWKKALIGGFCLLAVSVLVVLLVLCFRSKRVKVDKAAVSVWTKRPPEDDTANDEESSVVTNEPDVEYTEVVHPRAADPARVPLRKGTDTVYSELQNSPHGAADPHDYGSVEYAELNGEQPDINHFHPAVNSYQDLPVPVD